MAVIRMGHINGAHLMLDYSTGRVRSLSKIKGDEILIKMQMELIFNEILASFQLGPIQFAEWNLSLISAVIIFVKGSWDTDLFNAKGGKEHSCAVGLSPFPLVEVGSVWVSVRAQRLPHNLQTLWKKSQMKECSLHNNIDWHNCYWLLTCSSHWSANGSQARRFESEHEWNKNTSSFPYRDC